MQKKKSSNLQPITLKSGVQPVEPQIIVDNTHIFKYITTQSRIFLSPVDCNLYIIINQKNTPFYSLTVIHKYSDIKL